MMNLRKIRKTEKVGHPAGLELTASRMASEIRVLHGILPPKLIETIIDQNRINDIF